ncbi:MAG: ATP-binding protein [Limnobacter sp.]|uniref:sensor histidine kinase n=1 Tax=Limnobacter sp. TaxID=2003368 RepID=UPI0039195CA1
MKPQQFHHTALALVALMVTLLVAGFQEWRAYGQLHAEHLNIERMHALASRLSGAVQQSQQGAVQTGAEQWRRSFAELGGLIDVTFSSDSVDVSPEEIKQLLDGISALHVALMTPPEREVSETLKARREALLIERLLVQTQYLSELLNLSIQQLDQRREGVMTRHVALLVFGLGLMLLLLLHLVWALRRSPLPTGPERLSAAARDELRGQLLAERERGDALEQSLLQSRHYLYFMGHEVRNPLHAITGLVQLILELKPGGQVQTLLGELQSTSTDALNLVNQMLDLARLQADRMPLNNSDWSIESLLDHLSAPVHGLLAKSKCTVLFEVMPETPVTWSGDEVRIRQVLLNLIGNAIKFTPEGHVLVKVSGHDGAKGEVGLLSFEIQDTGTGIDTDTMDRLFGQFQQARAGHAQQHVGSGLGLNLVHGLVKLMGGQVLVNSTPGIGTCVTVDLPLRVAHGNASELQTASQPVPLVFVLSNDEYVLQSIQHTVRWMGMTVHGLRELLDLQAALKWATSTESRPVVVLVFEGAQGGAQGVNREAAESVAALWPKVPFLFLRQPADWGQVSEGDCAQSLSLPLSPADLRMALHRPSPAHCSVPVGTQG